jgi:hypothetical protein
MGSICGASNKAIAADIAKDGGDMNENNSGAIPETLYHYCGVSAFFSIMTNKQLWLSNATCMNDYTEHKRVYDRVKNRLLDLIPGENPHVAALVNELPGNISPYVFCLSSNGDSLSQWRAYTGDGAGFVIGFSGARLRERVRICNEEEVNEIALSQVVYDDCQQEKLVQGIIHDYLEEAGRLQPDDRDWIAMVRGEKLWNAAAICKNPGFHEEAEWRIVMMPVSDKEVHGGISDMCFCVRKESIIPYFTLPIQENLISTIWLGPKNYARDNKKLLEMFLGANGYGAVPIENSKATYR